MTRPRSFGGTRKTSLKLISDANSRQLARSGQLGQVRKGRPLKDPEPAGPYCPTCSVIIEADERGRGRRRVQNKNGCGHRLNRPKDQLCLDCGRKRGRCCRCGRRLDAEPKVWERRHEPEARQLAGLQADIAAIGQPSVPENRCPHPADRQDVCFCPTCCTETRFCRDCGRNECGH